MRKSNLEGVSQVYKSCKSLWCGVKQLAAVLQLTVNSLELGLGLGWDWGWDWDWEAACKIENNQ